MPAETEQKLMESGGNGVVELWSNGLAAARPNAQRSTPNAQRSMMEWCRLNECCDSSRSGGLQSAG
jgi:hypothetical protein